MAKLVTKFKVIKPGKKAGSYLKYFGTRDGVEKIDDSKKHLPETASQKDLIKKILTDFPDTKTMPEYADYLQKPTIENASEFISRSLEDNADGIIDGKTYADYIATRPRVERFGSHGLFTDDKKAINLSAVSKSLNEHTGNVWTVIISLRREDAARLGYDNAPAWRDMLRSQTEMFAENMKIDMKNMKWYAAFHNESHHPHVHMIFYSEDTSIGYLTKQGIRNIRSALGRTVFANDLLSVYEKQTEHRDALRDMGRQTVGEIVADINNGSYANPKVEEMLKELAVRLANTSGKKVYGYLKSDVKNLIDRIVDELADDDRISELYSLWYEKREEVISTYTEEMPKRIPLSQNKDFKSIRNAVINEAMNLNANKELSQSGVEDEYSSDEADGTAESHKHSSDKSYSPPKHTATHQPQSAHVGTASVRLLYYLSRLFQDRLENDRRAMLHGNTVDRKLMRKIEEKKQAHGLRMGG